MKEAKEALDILSIVVPWIKQALAKKRMSSTDISMLLLYDVAIRMGEMNERMGRIEQGFNNLTHSFELLIKEIQPIAQLAREALERRK